MNMNRRISLGLALVALAAIIGFGMLLFSAGKTSNAQTAAPAIAFANDVATSTSGATIATSVPPSGYLPYSNSQFHFSLDYPPNLQLQTYDEQGGGFTAAFQDPTTN